MNSQKEDGSAMIQRIQDNLQSTETEEVTKVQGKGVVMEEKVNVRNNTRAKILKPAKKTSWKRIELEKVMDHHNEDSILRKRKSTEIESEEGCTEKARKDKAKRMKHDGQDLPIKDGSIFSLEKL